jgi:hypothetical protein
MALIGKESTGQHVSRTDACMCGGESGACVGSKMQGSRVGNEEGLIMS